MFINFNFKRQMIESTSKASEARAEGSKEAALSYITDQLVMLAGIDASEFEVIDQFGRLVIVAPTELHKKIRSAVVGSDLFSSEQAGIYRGANGFAVIDKSQKSYRVESVARHAREAINLATA